VGNSQNDEIENPLKNVVNGLPLGDAGSLYRKKKWVHKKLAGSGEKPQLKSIEPRLVVEDSIPFICDE